MHSLLSLDHWRNSPFLKVIRIYLVANLLVMVASIRFEFYPLALFAIFIMRHANEALLDFRDPLLTIRSIYKLHCAALLMVLVFWLQIYGMGLRLLEAAEALPPATTQSAKPAA